MREPTQHGGALCKSRRRSPALRRAPSSAPTLLNGRRVCRLPLAVPDSVRGHGGSLGGRGGKKVTWLHIHTYRHTYRHTYIHTYTLYIL
ncbi:hypothetical protein FKM82_030910 [Ascaphus truei]